MGEAPGGAAAEVGRLRRSLLRERRRNRLFREAVRRAAHDGPQAQVVMGAIRAEADGPLGSAEQAKEIASLLAPVWHFSWVLSGALAACGVPDTRLGVRWLRDQGVRVLLSLEPAAVDWLAEAGIDSHAVDVPDLGVPSVEQLRGICGSIDASLADGKPVAVHCEAGIGRTSVVVAGYLVHRGATLEEALATVERTRPLPVSDPAALGTLRKLAGLDRPSG